MISERNGHQVMLILFILVLIARAGKNLNKGVYW